MTSEAAPYPRRKFSSSVTRTFVLLLSYLRLSLCTHCQISFSHLSTPSLTSVSHLCTYSRISLPYICALSLILDSHICALTLESHCFTFLHSLSYLSLSHLRLSKFGCTATLLICTEGPTLDTEIPAGDFLVDSYSLVLKTLD